MFVWFLSTPLGEILDMIAVTIVCVSLVVESRTRKTPFERWLVVLWGSLSLLSFGPVLDTSFHSPGSWAFAKALVVFVSYLVAWLAMRAWRPVPIPRHESNRVDPWV